MCSTEIVKDLCAAVNITGLQVVFKPEYVSSCSMPYVGDMDLLLASIDTNTIRLVGRWCRNFMMCYLHTSSQKYTSGMAVRMVQHGYYDIIPITHRG